MKKGYAWDQGWCITRKDYVESNSVCQRSRQKQRRRVKVRERSYGLALLWPEDRSQLNAS